MSYQLEIAEHQTISNSDLLARVAGVRDDNLRMDVGLRIVASSQGGGFELMLFGPSVQLPDGLKVGFSKRSATEIFALVEVCRQTWMSQVLKRTQRVYGADAVAKFEFPFERRWDFKDEPGLLDQVAPVLAQAGDQLFKLVFERECDEGLVSLSGTLRSILRSMPRYVAITSSKLFLPWGMLYTHPVEAEVLASDGSNWKKEGFWGYQHIVQQNPETIALETTISPSAGGVPFSINFDEGLSTSFNLPEIDKHFASIATLSANRCVKRTKKSELMTGFTSGRDKLERIIYFYCHGRGSTDASSLNLGETYLQMTDDRVSAYDFQYWSDNKKLPTSPLIFINACQGGQMTTIFYQTFAGELLHQGAVGLVGAQIDLPAVFAIEYAQAAFSRFFERNCGRVRLGPLLREINRVFWDTHKNPLGFVYSLYRGADCFIDWEAG